MLLHMVAAHPHARLTALDSTHDLVLRSRAVSAFTRVHSASKTRVNALVDALWRGVSKDGLRERRLRPSFETAASRPPNKKLD
jgi:hypothetical protein